MEEPLLHPQGGEETQASSTHTQTGRAVTPTNHSMSRGHSYSAVRTEAQIEDESNALQEEEKATHGCARSTEDPPPSAHKAGRKRVCGGVFSGSETDPPPKSTFVQQTVTSWSVLIPPMGAAALYFVVGIVCAMFAGLSAQGSGLVFEHSVQYGGARDESSYVAEATCSRRQLLEYGRTGRPNATDLNCNVSVTIPGLKLPRADEDTLPVNTTRYVEVQIYYHLTAFHQNHQLYVNSFSDEELQQGDILDPAASAACLQSSRHLFCDKRVPGTDRTYYPKGLQASSLFTDSIVHWPAACVRVENSSSAKPLYKNPDGYPAMPVLDPANASLLWQTFNETAGSELQLYPDGVQSPAFEEWMQPQAFPFFRKTWVALSCPVPQALSNGTQPDLTLDFTLRSNFDVEMYNGTKGFVAIVRNESWLLAPNPALAWLFLSAAVLNLCLATVMMLKRWCCARVEGLETSFLR